MPFFNAVNGLLGFDDLSKRDAMPEGCNAKLVKLTSNEKLLIARVKLQTMTSTADGPNVRGRRQLDNLFAMMNMVKSRVHPDSGDLARSGEEASRGQFYCTEDEKLAFLQFLTTWDPTLLD